MFKATGGSNRERGVGCSISEQHSLRPKKNALARPPLLTGKIRRDVKIHTSSWDRSSDDSLAEKLKKPIVNDDYIVTAGTIKPVPHSSGSSAGSPQSRTATGGGSSGSDKKASTIVFLPEEGGEPKSMEMSSVAAIVKASERSEDTSVSKALPPLSKLTGSRNSDYELMGWETNAKQKPTATRTATNRSAKKDSGKRSGKNNWCHRHRKCVVPTTIAGFVLLLILLIGVAVYIGVTLSNSSGDDDKNTHSSGDHPATASSPTAVDGSSMILDRRSMRKLLNDR